MSHKGFTNKTSHKNWGCKLISIKKYVILRKGILYLRVYVFGLFTYRVTSWQYKVRLFLGAVANLRKATISFVMSVCPHGNRLLRDGFV